MFSEPPLGGRIQVRGANKDVVVTSQAGVHQEVRAVTVAHDDVGHVERHGRINRHG